MKYFGMLSENCILVAISNPGEEDQQDYRTIPIYPTPEELHQEQKPFLRPNLTSQRYTNTHVYLDTHFRLLREDFVRPLRDGIQQLLLDQNNMGRNNNQLRSKRLDDIRVYFDTKLVVPKCTHDGMAYIVQFDSEPLKVSLCLIFSQHSLLYSVVERYISKHLYLYFLHLFHSLCVGRTLSG